jgi:hypothetical protein
MLEDFEALLLQALAQESRETAVVETSSTQDNLTNPGGRAGAQCRQDECAGYACVKARGD